MEDASAVDLDWFEAEASLNNFEKIINTPIEEKPENPIPLNAIEKLAFSELTFRHKSSSYDALSNINFEVQKGETIAFVGPSGSGKSTLVKLLVGLYSTPTGKIYYNDIESTKIDRDELQQQLGFVTQDTQLFAGTIRENLLFTKPEAT